MPKICCILIILLTALAGCTTTKVHLYTTYLTEQDVANISQSLERHNFTVIKNSLPVPDGITESTIIYSPLRRNTKPLEQAVALLSGAGWPELKTAHFVKGNHWYDDEHLGLIILPADFATKGLAREQQLARSYNGTNCQSPVEIDIQPNNRYKMTYQVDGQTKEKQGGWHIPNYPYLALEDGGGLLPMYFEVMQYMETDLIGRIDIIELKALQSYPILAKCQFKDGQRQQTR